MPLLPGSLAEAVVDASETLEAKLDDCVAYATQLGFQFGGEETMRRVLTEFACAEARRLCSTVPSAEALLAPERVTDPGCVEQLRALILVERS